MQEIGIAHSIKKHNFSITLIIRFIYFIIMITYIFNFIIFDGHFFIIFDVGTYNK